MINFKNLFYTLTCLSFTIIIGAGVYEHLAVWPRAFSAPPSSLTMFQGEYGLNAVNFWANIHPITILLFIATLIISWKSDRRKNILIAFLGYISVIIVTFLYFVPELMDMTGTTYTNTVDEALKNRGRLWKNLSLIRLITIIGLAIILFLGLTKADTKK